MNRRNRNDLVAAALARARRYGNAVKLHCPICDPAGSRSKSLSVDLSTGGWYCFRDTCGAKGRLGGLGMRREEEEQEPQAVSMPQGYEPLWLPEVKSAAVAAPAVAFLRKRGIREELWEEAQIGVCFSGRQYGRIIFPFLGPEGAWRGWVGRVWSEKVPEGVLKYFYPKGGARGSLLYNEVALHRRSDRALLVVEGALDALYLWPDAVATLGKHTDLQVDLVTKTERPVCFVNDGDAWKASFGLAYYLRYVHGTTRAGFLKLGPKKDPDAYDPELIRDAALKACYSEMPEFFAGASGYPLEAPK